MFQWLRPCVSNAGDAGSIPGQGEKLRELIPKVLPDSVILMKLTCR